MLPSKTLSKSFAQCQRHSAPPANGCERLTTVASAATTSREQGSTPRPPELNESPLLRIREKEKEVVESTLYLPGILGWVTDVKCMSALSSLVPTCSNAGKI